MSVDLRNPAFQRANPHAMVIIDYLDKVLFFGPFQGTISDLIWGPFRTKIGDHFGPKTERELELKLELEFEFAFELELEVEFELELEV